MPEDQLYDHAADPGAFEKPLPDPSETDRWYEAGRLFGWAIVWLLVGFLGCLVVLGVVAAVEWFA